MNSLPQSTAAPPTEESDKQAAARPVLTVHDGQMFPPAPENPNQFGVSETVVRDIALKLASTVPRFTTQWAAERLHLPLQLTEHTVGIEDPDYYKSWLSEKASANGS